MAERIGRDSARVEEYMTRDVATVLPEATVEEVSRRVAESTEHSGFPVSPNGGRRVVGYVSARDLLLADPDDRVRDHMSTDLLVANPEMDVQDAARVILRSGIRKLPVVDDAGDLVGIISNADVIRSQIERATPEKANKLKRTLETIHDVEATQELETVELAELVPTQPKVYADELEGRSYELERGLAEPIVVVDNDGELLLADGHHRVLAAREVGIDEMDAYVVAIGERVELGLARAAEDEGLESVEDVEVVDYARHPLVEATERLQ
ncbi:MAG: CBS domain-containing protein [Halobacteriaceae archaeon]